MADETLFRSLEIGTAEGRTLSGIAVPWDQPTRVRDLTGPAYVEAFAPTSADVSIRQHPSFPVFVRHDYGQDPLGVVTFTRSDTENALLFEAPLSKTRRADEALELVADGAMRSVSIGFRPLQLGKLRGVDAYRTEIALRELSLAPTGFGQYAAAEVLALRTEGAEGDQEAEEAAAAQAALDEAAIQAGTPTLDALKRRAKRIPALPTF